MSEEPKPPAQSKMLTSLSAAFGTLVGGVAMWITVNDSMTKAAEKKEVAIEARVKKDTLVETRIARLEERVEALRQAQEQLRTAQATAAAPK